MCLSSLVGTKKTSSSGTRESSDSLAAVAILRSSSSHPNTSSSDHWTLPNPSDARSDTQIHALRVNILPPVPALRCLLSTTAGYCQIGKTEIADLLESGREFISRKNATGRRYGRAEQEITAGKVEMERTIIVKRSRRITGLITGY
jgi:hypothetical protein